MPATNYLSITIASQPVDVASVDDFPIAINYSLENPEDFQKKESNTALNVKLPATLQNRKVANSYHDPASEDLTPGQVHKSHQPAVIEADGEELLNGKAFLENATHGATPTEYEYSFYGGNADWMVDMKEKTLYDFVQGISFTNDQVAVVYSWGFDGTDETLPYVFAPVRYRGFMDDANQKDDNVAISYLRPSISKYWLLYWGFKSLGYRIAPDGFTDTEYFRRQVMPWTWGSYLQSEGTKLDIHGFLAKSEHERFINDEYDGILELYIKDTELPGVYDNNDEFTYAGQALTWEYKAPFSGKLDAHFSFIATTTGNIVGDNSFFQFYVRWYYTPAGGSETQFDTQMIFEKSGGNLSVGDYFDVNHDMFNHHEVDPGDKITARFFLKLHEGSGVGARVNFHTIIDEFKRDYFTIPTGGTISFANYNGFKKYKWLDFLAGVCDEFNISPVTDVTNKVVYLEPMHGYEADGVQQQGFFVDDYVDWSGKIDLSKEANMNLFSDYEKEVLFRYKDDSNDGVLKVVQDRNQNVMAAGKYVFPDRFKAGKREHENRFFSPTMHYEAEQFKAVTGVAPQMVCIIPENISNTSNSEADNTFAPKSCYYKGLVTDAGGWRFNGFLFSTFPYMFAVNYKAGGENDPVLSYCDENINGVLAPGLMKKFFTQRLAIMRNGQFYEPFMKLNNTEVSRLHREYKVFDGQRWELVQIKNYLPLKNETTAVFLRKWAPVIEADYNNSFPSEDSVINNAALVGNDVKYAKLICLSTDIPR
jgi:hypothetical protein